MLYLGSQHYTVAGSPMSREAVLTARRNAIRRCTDPRSNRYQYYGARGIKCLLSRKDIILLANRDRVWELKKPQLHRRDNTKDYTVENCCFVPAAEHSRITHTGATRTQEARQRMSASGGTLYGEKHGCAKLSTEQVVAIRSSGLPGRVLAAKFNVHESTICAIRHRRIWAWLSS